MSVKPKVMRRPATLIRTESSAEILPMDEVKLEYVRDGVASPSPAESTSPGWQEDGRFGVALLVIVLLTNLLVALVLAPRQAHDTHSAADDDTMLTAPSRLAAPATTVHVLDDKASPVGE